MFEERDDKVIKIESTLLFEDYYFTQKLKIIEFGEKRWKISSQTPIIS